MKLCFDSIEEVKTFVAGLKGTRGGKKGDDEQDNAAPQGIAPSPAMPPQQGQQPAFQPAAGFPGAGGPAPTFPGPGGAPAVDPAVVAIVGRIVAKIDGAIQGGQPADQVLNWFRGQAGTEAANATMDQIKQHFLPKLAVPSLENIAKLMNA